MVYRILFFLCLFISISGNVFAETVKSFHVNGNTRLDKQTIVGYLPFGIGDNPSISQIDEGTKSLLRSDLFANVQIISDGNGSYSINVDENPIITKIYFEGNDRYDDQTLSSEILLKEGSTLTDSRVKSSIVRLQELYQRSGRYDVDINPQIIKKEDNRIDFIFDITERDIIYIDDISFIGNKVYSDSRLKEVIESSEDRWWRFFSSNSTYDEDRLNLDKSLLTDFYKQKGFVDFIVESATVELTSDKKSFIIKFVVSEGKRYKINNVSIDDRLSSVSEEEIFEFIDQENGDYFNKKTVGKNEEDIVLFLSSKGYPFVTVFGDIQRVENDTLDLTYVISESQPSYVERIDITGNVRTIEEVIRRRLSIVEGDPLNRSLLKKSERDLRGTGFFSKVDFIERSGSSRGQVDMKIDVEEQSTGDITFGAGYSTTDNILGEISLSERNFLGRGQYVRVSALASGRRQQFDFGFTEPFLLGRDLAGGFDIFHITSDYSSEASYDEQNTGFVLRSSFMAAEDLSFRPRYKINYDEIENLRSDASQIVRDTANRGGLISSSIGYEALYDKRDDFIEPTEGYMIRVNQDIAGIGGDVNLVKTVASGRYYYTPIEQYTFAFEIEGGAVVPFGGYDSRIIDRQFLGGASFRGFEVAGLGPRYLPTAAGENDDAVGGTYFTVLRSELAFPLPGLEDAGMSGALFNDTGTLWNVDHLPSGVPSSEVRDDANIRSSVGFGIKWRSPVGPIRLDFSYPFLKQDHDRTEVFRFSAGSSF